MSGLLVLNEGAGKLAVYDARTGAKLDQLLFPEQIAYYHFSDDGKRLFVLTQNQLAFVMDVSGVTFRQPDPAISIACSSAGSSFSPARQLFVVVAKKGGQIRQPV